MGYLAKTTIPVHAINSNARALCLQVAQALCADAKAKKMAQLAAKVPAAKRSFESLIFAVKAFLNEVCGE